MKKIKYLIVLVMFFAFGCHEKQAITDKLEEKWSNREAQINPLDSLEYGKTYLSVYSQMYSLTQKQKYNLTGMISLRNVSETDTIFLLRADYYNTEGHKIRTYIEKPVFISPMETLEIVIAQKDVEGGTGSNFIFEWKTPMNCPEPLFEGVMNSMQGTQGISFTTNARRIK